jgi:hypothetical protein
MIDPSPFKTLTPSQRERESAAQSSLSLWEREGPSPPGLGG